MSPEKLAITHEAFSAAELQPNVKAQVHAVETGKGQIVRVVEIDARPDTDTGYEHTIIWPAAFQARAELTNIQRLRVLAEQLMAKVLYVETPGVSVDMQALQETTGARATLRQVSAALRGDFRPHAAVQLQALHKAVPFKDGEQLHILGYSMGTPLAVFLAQQLGGQPFGADITPQIARLDLIDPVNDQPWQMHQLLKAIRQEGAVTLPYIEENKALHLEPNPYDLKTEAEARAVRKLLERQQALGIYSVAAGLRKVFAPVLAQAIHESQGNNTTRLDEINPTFYHANASFVSRAAAHVHTAEQIHQTTGVRVRQVELTKPSDGPLHHPFPRSFARLLDLALQDFK